jgi:hypothetical protein
VYEACSTSAFARGRTESIRSVTEPSARLVARAAAAVARGAGGRVEPREAAALRALLADACAAQAETTKWCQQGLGHERHLLALRDLATEPRAAETRPGSSDADGAEAAGVALPALFTDAGWPLLTASTLSTSCLRSDSIRGFAFGPVVRDGYGVAYVYDQRGVTVNVTNYTAQAAGARQTDSGRFATALGEALGLFGQLLDGQARSKL